MAVSAVQICNMALARIGQTIQIGSLDEKSKAAEVCTTFYEQSLADTIRDIKPRFALRAVPLASPEGATFPGWSFVYRYPANCLLAEMVVPETGLRNSMIWPRRGDGSFLLTQVSQLINEIPFDISSDVDGRLILTDLPEAWLIYYALPENTTAFDSMFTRAFAARLAWDIAMPMTKDPRIDRQARDAWREISSAAAAVNSNEPAEDPLPESPSILARM